MEVRFGPWLPDQMDYKNPGLEECVNCIPSTTGYQPARAAVASGATVSGTIIGAGSAFLENGSSVVFVATTTDLHVIRGGSVTDSSLSLTLAASDTVKFAQFGASIYATTKDGSTWALSDITSDNTFSIASGSPPSANAIGRVSDFLVLGDLTDIDASNAPFRIRWSRFNNPGGAWGTDIATQSGAVDLDGKYGKVTAIAGGTSGLVFQERGVSRLSFTGGAAVFSLDLFEKNRGCVAPASLVQVGDRVFYLSHDGFFVTDGTTPQSISNGRVWSWLEDRVNQAFQSRIVGAADYQRRCIMWLIPTGADNTLTEQIWFHWDTGQWSTVEGGYQWAIEGAKGGQTLEQVAVTYPDLDAMPLSLDSATFKASGRDLQVMDDGELSTLTGSPLRPTLRTGEFQPVTGRRSFVRAVTPLITNGAPQVAISGRSTMQAQPTLSAYVGVGAVGYAPLAVDARFFSVAVQIPGGAEWSDAYGLQIETSVSGLS